MMSKAQTHQVPPILILNFNATIELVSFHKKVLQIVPSQLVADGDSSSWVRVVAVWLQDLGARRDGVLVGRRRRVGGAALAHSRKHRIVLAVLVLWRVDDLKKC